MHIKLMQGDVLEQLKKLDDNSIDSVVTDPPYGLEFMGKQWDGADGFRRSLNANDVGRDNAFGRTSRTSPEYKATPVFQEWCEAWAAECLRVLKPGGHLLSFGGSRTYHRMACAIEDAGFQIRDQIMWIYGSGFPKSLDVSKAIDKAAGAEREVVGFDEHKAKQQTSATDTAAYGDYAGNNGAITAPSTEAAKQWQGWGTALKPAHEPIVVARKPLIGTVAQNVLEHGTGAVNIDGCRIEGEKPGHGPRPDMRGGNYNNRDGEASNSKRYTENGSTNFAALPGPRGGSPDGRWPANVIHDGSDEVTDLFPQTTSGTLTPEMNVKASTGWSGGSQAGRVKSSFAANKGSAARFFYCAKANKKDREEGNNHPTVKPTDLMRYLVRLVTPPDGIVLDPFMGSGSTGKAAILEGFSFTGIELDQAYVDIAVNRLSALLTEDQFIELAA